MWFLLNFPIILFAEFFLVQKKLAKSVHSEILMNYSCLEVIFKIHTVPIFLFFFW